ncbi:hypothetical protein FIBSPDRAFT_850058 [Athelia psychrophila]|uniref:Uncharacterized protein n=1 Tax=Athelia psychrophila TaxID=1759441 RepID=A0A166TWU5_9AGAM|nr:hypothetical protein FIBSPDRAFT_850058 [Fibularhizoctonia sp. CBS 109695]
MSLIASSYGVLCYSKIILANITFSQLGEYVSVNDCPVVAHINSCFDFTLAHLRIYTG